MHTSRGRNGADAVPRIRDVESVEIHYLVPGRDKVVNKLLLRIGTGVNFGQRAELRV